LPLDEFDHIQTLNNFAEDDVGTIEPRCNDGGDEELRSVGVLSSVGHGEETRLGVLQLEVLVSELLAVDGLSTGSIVLGEVTTLQHELGDDTMERAAFVSKSVLTGGEFTEVPGSLGNNIVIEPEDDATGGLVVDCDIKEDVGHFGVSCVCKEVGDEEI